MKSITKKAVKAGAKLTGKTETEFVNDGVLKKLDSICDESGEMSLNIRVELTLNEWLHVHRAAKQRNASIDRVVNLCINRGEDLKTQIERAFA